MRTMSLVFLILTLTVMTGYTQNKTLAIGTSTPNPNAALHAESPTNNQGFILPRLTTAQRTAAGFVSILGAGDNGLMVYDSDEKILYIWDGAAWKSSQQVAQANTASQLVLPYIQNATTAPNNSNVIDITYSGSAVENVGLVRFANLNPNNGYNTLFVTSAGLNGAGYFQVSNGGSLSPALRGITNSNQSNVHAILGNTTGTGGSGGYFSVSNATSAQAGLTGTTSGTGPAGVLTVTNVANTNPALLINHSGTGNAITANKPIQATQFIGDGSLLTGISGGGGWGLIGSAGTVDGTNFIGTTDDIPLSFKVNSQKAGRIDQTLANTFFGYQSGNAITTGNYNTAIGFQSLFSNFTGYDNTAIGAFALHENTGIQNTAVGNGALYNNTGGQNVSVGAQALSNNTTGSLNVGLGFQSLNSSAVGSANTAIGNQSLFSNVAGSAGTAVGVSAMKYSNDTSTPFTNSNVAVGFETLRGSSTPSVNTGNNNTAIGYQALWSNTIGASNAVVGYQALFSNSSGYNNSVSGSFALNANTTGRGNIASGFQALASNTTGNDNTAVGYHALIQNITGTGNTAIGNGADISLEGIQNATAIGNGAIVNASNKVRIGNSSITVIEGQVGFTAASDKRLKTNIQDLTEGLDFVMKLKPVSYHMKNQENPKLNWGFIAQDIEALVGTENAILTIGGDEKHTLGLRYTDFVAPLVKAMQEQQSMIDKLTVIMQSQSEEIETLKMAVKR